MSEQMITKQGVRDWAIAEHIGCPRPRFQWEQTWRWAECRLCLFTWRGMIEQHDPECPLR